MFSFFFRRTTPVIYPCFEENLPAGQTHKVVLLVSIVSIVVQSGFRIDLRADEDEVAVQSASRLDTDAGLAPMPPLGVVPVRRQNVSPATLCSFHQVACIRPAFVFLESRWRCDEPDGVAGPEADPLGDGAVLLLRLRKLLLGAERLLAL